MERLPSSKIRRFGAIPLFTNAVFKASASVSFSPNTLPPERTAIVGDRLYTDIALGKRFGVTAVLVLSGETKEADVDAADLSDKPDFVFGSLDDVNRVLFE